MRLSDLRRLTEVAPKEMITNDQKRMNEFLLNMGIDPNTFYQELEMTSSLVDTHRDVSYSNAHIQLHSHSFYELIYCRNTCGAEYLIGSDRYRLMRGDVVFIPPGVSHRPLLSDHIVEPYKRYVLWMSTEFVEQYGKLFPYPFSEKQAYPSMLRTGGTQWGELLAELFREGVKEAEAQEDGWEAAIIGNTITLLTQIKRATNDQAAMALEAEKPELLDRIMAYVEANFAKDISIEEVAKQLFVSNSTISHLFKQKMGISFYRFVTQRRLIAAKKLIEKDIHLETVGIQVGFADYSGFYRAFKKEYGISPRQYRNLLG
ncbi:MAG: helix-turn-helix transcriptional regulator [Lachnospiraceae bacterium]|nr:helix-turn-helix transcriptional regulator [Lachnospiraceae bacterium]